MDYDKPSVVMVEKIGAIMVPADLGSIGPKFNNGDVDAVIFQHQRTNRLNCGKVLR